MYTCPLFDRLNQGCVDRTHTQIEHATHIATEAKFVKLVDKICNLRNILVSPPANWSIEDKRKYSEWAGRVVTGLGRVHPSLEAVFGGLLARRTELY